MSSLDYYCGRPFKEVVEKQTGGKSKPKSIKGKWEIHLEGDVIIRNHDNRRTAVPDANILSGSSFLAPVYAEDATTLQFGFVKPGEEPVIVSEIVLTPKKYSVSDDQYTGGREVFPQADDEGVDPLPPDPSPERVADGPTEDAEGVSNATPAGEERE